MATERRLNYLIPQPRIETYPGLRSLTEEEEDYLTQELPYLEDFGYLIDEEQFRQTFNTFPQYSGQPNLLGVMDERVELSKYLSELGFLTCSFTRTPEWIEKASETGIILFDGLGPTENTPVFTGIHILGVPFRTLDDKDAMICSSFIRRVPEFKPVITQDERKIRFIEHPEYIIPHEVIPSPLTSGENLTILTSWTDYVFGVFSDVNGAPHLFMNECVFPLAEKVGKTDALFYFTDQSKHSLAGVHLLPFEEWRATPTNGIDLGDSGILIGNALKSARIMQNVLNREIHTAKTDFRNNRIGGNAGPRCIALPLHKWDLDFLRFFAQYYEEYVSLNGLDPEVGFRLFVKDNYKFLWQMREHYRFVYLRKTYNNRSYII